MAMENIKFSSIKFNSMFIHRHYKESKMASPYIEEFERPRNNKRSISKIY